MSTCLFDSNNIIKFKVNRNMKHNFIYQQRELYSSHLVVSYKQTLRFYRAVKLLIVVSKIYSKRESMWKCFQNWKKNTQEGYSTGDINRKKCKIVTSCIDAIFFKVLKDAFFAIKQNFREQDEDQIKIFRMIKQAICQIPSSETVSNHKDSKSFLLNLGFCAMKNYKYSLVYKKAKGILLIVPILTRKINNNLLKSFSKFKQSNSSSIRQSFRKIHSELKIVEAQCFILPIIQIFQKKKRQCLCKIYLCAQEATKNRAFDQFQNIALQAIRIIGPLMMTKKVEIDMKIKGQCTNYFLQILDKILNYRKIQAFEKIFLASTFHPEQFLDKKEEIETLERQLEMLKEDVQKSDQIDD